MNSVMSHEVSCVKGVKKLNHMFENPTHFKTKLYIWYHSF